MGLKGYRPEYVWRLVQNEIAAMPREKQPLMTWMPSRTLAFTPSGDTRVRTEQPGQRTYLVFGLPLNPGNQILMRALGYALRHSE